MTSNLACVGLAVADREEMRDLIGVALETAEPIGRSGSVVLYRWQDPSGARLVISTEGKRIVGFLPSFASEPGACLDDVRAASEDVAVADVLDEDGELVTRLAAEFEQRPLLPAGPVAGRASIIALGVEVSIHASAEAFATADASLLSASWDPGEPPAHYVENGWDWPPRMAPESFIPYGMFHDAAGSAEAYARLNGVVLAADLRTVTATGQRFIATRVRTAGFEADVCLPADDEMVAPPPGSIIAGTVFLVASMPDLPLPQRAGSNRSWLPWRR